MMNPTFSLILKLLTVLNTNLMHEMEVRHFLQFIISRPTRRSVWCSVLGCRDLLQVDQILVLIRPNWEQITSFLLVNCANTYHSKHRSSHFFPILSLLILCHHVWKIIQTVYILTIRGGRRAANTPLPSPSVTVSWLETHSSVHEWTKPGSPRGVTASAARLRPARLLSIWGRQRERAQAAFRWLAGGLWRKTAELML